MSIPNPGHPPPPTEARITEAASRLLVEGGVLSVQAVASEAGVPVEQVHACYDERER